MQSDERQGFEALAQLVIPSGTLLRAWELEGGVSAQVTALEIERPAGRTETVLVRQHGAVDLARNPNIAADEFRLLQILLAVGLPAPKPLYLTQPTEDTVPAVVMEFVDGTTEIAPADATACVLQLATTLAEIHSVDYARFDLSFLPEQTAFYTAKLGNRPMQLDHTLDEGRIRETLEAVWPLPPLNAPTLLHGDFWPGNVLWKDGRLAAVIDWEDAAVGDPLADLANSRLEILWNLGGVAAMRDFTQQYKSIMSTLDYSHLPYWDLCAALRPAGKLAAWDLERETVEAMQASHRRFVAEAYAALGEGGSPHPPAPSPKLGEGE